MYNNHGAIYVGLYFVAIPFYLGLSIDDVYDIYKITIAALFVV